MLGDLEGEAVESVTAFLHPGVSFRPQSRGRFEHVV